jgi:SOS-response transcriptional repressor LexA
MAQVEPIATHSANLYIVSAEFPGGEEFNIGVLLEDSESNQLHVKLRHDWDAIAPDDYYDYLAALESDFRERAEELGAQEFLARLTSQLSNVLRITDPQRVVAGKFPRTLVLLYERHIHPRPLKYQTHLPLYTLRSAAGKFLENAEIECESWVEAPARLRLTQDMFVAEIQGTSMEPLVHDGDLALFRFIPPGSRVGKRVLVEERGRGGESYTLKLYTRPKGLDRSDRGAVTLEPLNPEHQPIPLEPDDERYRIIAEFVQTIN